MKRVIIFLLLAILILWGSGCGQATVYESPISEITIEYRFSEKFMRISGYTPEEWLANLEKVENTQYHDLYISHDGTTVCLVLFEHQIDIWKAHFDSTLQELQSDFAALSDGYKIEVSDDYAHIGFYIGFYFNKNYDSTKLSYIGEVILYCTCRQIFEDVHDGHLYVSMNIYNSDTGKLVKSADCDMYLHITQSDWDASM